MWILVHYLREIEHEFGTRLVQIYEKKGILRVHPYVFTIYLKKVFRLSDTYHRISS